MTVWIDNALWANHGTVFGHLISDTSLDELHRVAQRAGLNPRAFDGDHYDVPIAKRDDCIAAGAIATSGPDLVRRLNASGLRLRKRHSDRAVARLQQHWLSNQPVDIDLVAGSKPLNENLVGMAIVFLHSHDGELASVFSPRRQEWGPPGGWREDDESVAEGAAREVLEETGLVVDPLELKPAGWIRYNSKRRWLRLEPGVHHMQVFMAEVERQLLVSEGSDIPVPRWLSIDEAAAQWADQHWMPLFEQLFMRLDR